MGFIRVCCEDNLWFLMVFIRRFSNIYFFFFNELWCLRKEYLVWLSFFFGWGRFFKCRKNLYLLLGIYFLFRFCL